MPLRVNPLLESFSSVSIEQNIHLSKTSRIHFFFLSKVKSNYRHFSSGLKHQYTTVKISANHTENALHSLGALKRRTVFLLKVS